MKCINCKYAKTYYPIGINGMRNRVICEHPDQEYIYEYCRSHRVAAMPGFIGFTKPFSNELNIKTSPRWCPLKKESKE